MADGGVTGKPHQGAEDEYRDRPATPDHQDAVITVSQRVGH
jgi:hypothetical protein